MRHQCLQARHTAGASSMDKCILKWYTLVHHSSKRGSWALIAIHRVAPPNPARLAYVPLAWRYQLETRRVWQRRAMPCIDAIAEGGGASDLGRIYATGQG